MKCQLKLISLCLMVFLLNNAQTPAEPRTGTATISGTITEREPQGRALTVKLRSADGTTNCTCSVPFGSLRSFEFTSVRPGRYQLSVINTNTKIDFQVGQGETKVFDLLVDSAKTASVKIAFYHGQKLCTEEQLKVSFYPSPEMTTYEPFPLKRNVANGVLHLLGLNEGRYFLKVYEFCRRSTLYELDVTLDREPNTFDIQLDYTCSFFGKIVDEKNKAEDGIFIRTSLIFHDAVESNGSIDTTGTPSLLEYKAFAISDYNGHFLFNGLREGTYSVCIDPEKENPLVIEGFVDADNNYPVNIHVLPSQPPRILTLKENQRSDEILLEAARCESTLSGTVTLAGGKPAPNAIICARPDKLNRGQGKPLIFRTGTNASGKFSFSELPEDIYRIDAAVEGFPQMALYNVNVQKTTAVELKLPSKKDLYYINGSVLIEGAGQEQVAITLLPRAPAGPSNVFNSELRFRTDEDGSFGISPVFPGTYDLIVEGYTVVTPSIIVLSGEQKNRDIKLKLRPPKTGPQIEIRCKKKILPSADFAAFLSQINSAEVTVFAKDAINEYVNGAAISPTLNSHLIAGLSEGEYNLYMLSRLGNIYTIKKSLPVSNGRTVQLEYDLDE